MKITIDEENKTIEIEGEVKISEFQLSLKAFFQDKNVNDYKLIGTKKITEYLPYYPPIIQREYPWWPVTYCGDNTTFTSHDYIIK